MLMVRQPRLRRYLVDRLPGRPAQGRRAHSGGARPEDRILPIDSTARRLPDLIADCTLIEIDDGPHNICWTHADETNAALLDFLANS